MAVTAETIATALGRASFTEAEGAQWALWIADAQMLIEARLGDLSELDAAKLDYVIREAVVAHVRHPDDATQVSVSIDDGSTSRTYRSGKGRVSILDEWWELLSPSTSGAFNLDLINTTGTHQPWCSLAFDATYCSCGADIASYPLYEW